MSPSGQLCSDSGDLEVSNLEDCKLAAKEWHAVFWQETNSRFYPRGCFAFYGRDHFYFNHHATGHSNSRHVYQICYQIGKSVKIKIYK